MLAENPTPSQLHKHNAFTALLRRDIMIALRVGGGTLTGVLFFLAVIVLMPFALGPDLALLQRLGPAILWLGAMLASLLTLERLFAADLQTLREQVSSRLQKAA